MSWVKFHEELTQDGKRGLPRAVRFVYMELSLKARRKRGVIELPRGMGDLDGVRDLLGGDPKEIKTALDLLCSGSDPMLAFEGDAGSRRLVVIAWTKWNPGEQPGASTERSRRFRSSSTDATDAGNADATHMQRSLQPVAGPLQTDSQRSCNEPQRSPFSRVEKSRSEDPPVVPPSGDTPPPASVSKPRVRAKGTKSEIPPSSVLAFELTAWLDRWRIPPLDDPKFGEKVTRFVNYHRSHGTKFVDWGSAWANWRDDRFITRKQPSQPQPAAPEGQECWEAKAI